MRHDIDHRHAPELPRQRLVLFDVLPIFPERRRGNHSVLAAGEHRFENIGRVRLRAKSRSGTGERVHLVEEQDQIRTLLQFLDDMLRAPLEHAAQDRGYQRVDRQAHDLAAA